MSRSSPPPLAAGRDARPAVSPSVVVPLVLGLRIHAASIRRRRERTRGQRDAQNRKHGKDCVPHRRTPSCAPPVAETVVIDWLGPRPAFGDLPAFTNPTSAMWRVRATGGVTQLTRSPPISVAEGSALRRLVVAHVILQRAHIAQRHAARCARVAGLRARQRDVVARFLPQQKSGVTE